MLQSNSWMIFVIFFVAEMYWKYIKHKYTYTVKGKEVQNFLLQRRKSCVLNLNVAYKIYVQKLESLQFIEYLHFIIEFHCLKSCVVT
jgi:hypothetical protein